MVQRIIVSLKLYQGVWKIRGFNINKWVFSIIIKRKVMAI